MLAALARWFRRWSRRPRGNRPGELSPEATRARVEGETFGRQGGWGA